MCERFTFSITTASCLSPTLSAMSLSPRSPLVLDGAFGLAAEGLRFWRVGVDESGVDIEHGPGEEHHLRAIDRELETIGHVLLLVQLNSCGDGTQADAGRQPGRRPGLTPRRERL